MLRWRDFFCPDDAGAAELVHRLGARLLGSDGEPPASAGEVVDIAAHRDPARPGHVTSPEPLVHPRLRDRIAAALGLTPAQVAAVARYDTCILDGEFVGPDRLPTVDYDIIADNGGGAALRRLLIDRTGSDDLLLDHVPLLPTTERPPALSDAGELVPGALDRAYERLLAALAVHRRYLELRVPCMMRMAQWERAQDAFDALCAAIAGEPDPRARPFAMDDDWLERRAADLAHSRGSGPDSVPAYCSHLHAALHPAPPSPPLPRHGYHVDPLTPLVCRFVGDDGLLLVLPHAVVLLDATTGDLRFAVPAVTSDVLAVTGDHAVFVARGDLLAQVHVLDLRRGVYRSDWDGLAPPVFPMAPYKSDEWCVYDYGHRLARPLPDPGNYKGGAVLGLCLRHAWIEGTARIFRLTDFLPQFDLDDLPRPGPPPPLALWRRGEQPPDIDPHDPTVFPFAAEAAPPGEPDDAEEEAYESDDEEDDDPRLAFALAHDGFRVFWRGALHVRRVPVLRLEHPFASVALDRAGERLLVAYPGELALYPLGPGGAPGPARRLSFTRHADAVTLAALRGRVPGLDRAVEMQLLSRFGTVDALRRATVEQLSRVAGSPPMLEDEYRPLPAELAQAIQGALRGFPRE